MACILKKTISRFKLSVSDLGIWFWGFDGFISLLPSLNRTRTDRIQRIDETLRVPEPQADSFHSVQPPKVRENSLGKNFHIFYDFLIPMSSKFGNNYKGNVNKCLGFYTLKKKNFIP